MVHKSIAICHIVWYNLREKNNRWINGCCSVNLKGSSTNFRYSDIPTYLLINNRYHHIPIIHSEPPFVYCNSDYKRITLKCQCFEPVWEIPYRLFLIFLLYTYLIGYITFENPTDGRVSRII